MVSQFGSLGYTIMGKTADLTVVQKTIIDTLHKEGKPQTFIAKEGWLFNRGAVSKHVNRKVEWKEKMHNKTERTAALWGLSSKIDSRFGWTSQGMDWGWGQGIKSNHNTDVSREFGYSCRIPLVKPLLNHRQNVRGHLYPGLRRRRTEIVAQWSQVLFFRWEQVFVFHLETKVLGVWRKGGEAS